MNNSISKDGVFALKVEGDENLRKLYIKIAKGHLHFAVTYCFI